jgi:hypothetical protein
MGVQRILVQERGGSMVACFLYEGFDATPSLSKKTNNGKHFFNGPARPFHADMGYLNG